MIKRKDTNTGDKLHQVKIEFVTDNHWEKIQAVVYPNY